MKLGSGAVEVGYSGWQVIQQHTDTVNLKHMRWSQPLLQTDRQPVCPEAVAVLCAVCLLLARSLGFSLSVINQYTLDY